MSIDWDKVEKIDRGVFGAYIFGMFGLAAALIGTAVDSTSVVVAGFIVAVASLIVEFGFIAVGIRELHR